MGTQPVNFTTLGKLTYGDKFVTDVDDVFNTAERLQFPQHRLRRHGYGLRLQYRFRPGLQNRPRQEHQGDQASH